MKKTVPKGERKSLPKVVLDLENAPQEDLIEEIKHLRHIQEFHETPLSQRPREELIKELKLRRKVCDGSLGGAAVYALISLIKEGEISAQLWKDIDTLVERLVSLFIFANRGDEIAAEQIEAIYRLMFFKTFKIKRKTIQDIASKQTPKPIAQGLELWGLMHNLRFFVVPVEGNYKRVFDSSLRLTEYMPWQDKSLYQFLHDYFQSTGNKKVFLEDLAIEVYLNQLRSGGIETITRSRLKSSLRSVKKFFETVELRSLYDDEKIECDPTKFFRFAFSDGWKLKPTKVRFDRKPFIDAVDQAILKLSENGSSSRQITEKRVAQELADSGFAFGQDGTREDGLGRKDTSADMLRQRLRDCEIKERWGQYVDSVLARPRTRVIKSKKTENKKPQK